MKVDTVKYWLFVFILVFFIVFEVFLIYAPTASDFENTYQRPIDDANVTLYSQRWSFYFFVTGLYQLLWAAPLTLMFAMDDTLGRRWAPNKIYFSRRMFHNAVVMLLGLWFLATFIYSCVLWSRANVNRPDNYFNPANDPRWCCVHYSQENHSTNPWFPCVRTTGCNGVGESSLTTNPVFLFQLWYNLALLAFFVADLMLANCFMAPVYHRYALEAREPLLGK